MINAQTNGNKVFRKILRYTKDDDVEITMAN